MNKLNFRTLVIPFVVVLLFGNTSNAQPLCGQAQIGVIIYVYEVIEDEECTESALLSGLELKFWTTDGGGDDFFATSDGSGTIQHCFPYQSRQWFMRATTDPSGCTVHACDSYFNPVNLQCLPYVWGCEGGECYCPLSWWEEGPCSGDANMKIVKKVNIAPSKFNLFQNYPNPFNPITKIVFDLPLETRVKLRIYDLSGKEVETLVDGTYKAGNYTINFDASSLSSGMYFYNLQTPEFTDTKKMIVVK